MPPPLDEIPPPVNRPPRILPQNLAPAPTYAPPTVAAACPETLGFKASLTDPDGDIIYWRVFIDYFADINREPPEKELIVEGSQSAPIQFNIDDAASLGDTNPHTVELYVADRPFAYGQLVPQGRVLIDDQGLVDTFVWTIEIDERLDSTCPE